MNASKLVVAVALSLAVVFALSAAYYSVRPAPPADSYGCLHPNYGNYYWIHNASGVMKQYLLCYQYQDRLSAWNVDYSSPFSPVSIWRWTSVEMAEGFAALSLLFLIVPRLKFPETMSGKLALPRLLRLTVISVGAVGFGLFGYGELFNILYANTGQQLYISLFQIDPQMPLHAVLGLLGASVCFGILKARKGFSEGVRHGIAFGALSILAAQLCLLVFDYKEMHLYVTTFSSGWVLFGVPVLSNWSVLIVSASLAVLWGQALRSRGERAWSRLWWRNVPGNAEG